jgi:ribosomal RNA assembly protein
LPRFFQSTEKKYIKECFPLLTNNFLTNHGIKAALDVMEGSITVTTTRKMSDAYAIIKARDIVKLICRGVPYPQAIKLLDDDNVACDIIKIGRLVRNRDRFVRRRQRLVGPSGATLKAVELLTDCYVLIQGNTISSIGPFKGLAAVRKIAEDCLIKNIHPVFNVKRLLIQKELAKDPSLANASWERFLPQLPKTTQPKQKKAKINKKKEYTPFPPEQPMSKVDEQLLTGEYFLNQEKKSQEKRDEAAASAKKGKFGGTRGPRPKFGGSGGPKKPTKGKS